MDVNMSDRKIDNTTMNVKFFRFFQNNTSNYDKKKLEMLLKLIVDLNLFYKNYLLADNVYKNILI